MVEQYIRAIEGEESKNMDQPNPSGQFSNNFRVTCILNIYTLQNDVNNDYRMGSRERMREERSRSARRGGGREGEREGERERQKKKEPKKH